MIDHDAIPEVGGMEWTHGLGHDRRGCRVKPYDMAMALLATTNNTPGRKGCAGLDFRKVF